MGSKAVKYILFLVIAVVIVWFISSFSLNQMIKSQIEEAASEMTGTEVTIDRLSLSLLGGTGSVSGFTIANPEGFDGDHALSIESATLRMEPRALFSDPVVVKSVEIEELSISYQLSTSGTNFGQIRSNLEDHTADQEGRDLIIERLLMEETTATLSVDGADLDQLEFTLSRIERTDIGREGDRSLETTLMELLTIILSEVDDEVIDQIREEAGSRILDEIEGLLDGLF
ncbi:MAG: AsmA family protein [Balneolaceae bacterium]|nr:AsmA family protein [Balneolaceae bacterium]